MAFRIPAFLRRGSSSPRNPAVPATPPTTLGPLTPTYAPQRDGLPDPGEVCWAWVPYEEDARRGKDRPVLVLAVVGPSVIALPLTSKDHDRDAAQEARAGRLWMDVGSGDWDRERRPSEVRINRVLTLDATTVRREGGALPRPVFDAVVAAAAPYFPGATP